jgi:hypothetical protein
MGDCCLVVLDWADGEVGGQACEYVLVRVCVTMWIGNGNGARAATRMPCCALGGDQFGGKGKGREDGGGIHLRGKGGACLPGREEGLS